MKRLIVYYSHTGNNEALALELKKRTGFDIRKINEVGKRKTISILFDFFFTRTPKITDGGLDLKEYSGVIFVAPVWGGKVASPLRAFIEKKKENIKAYSFISICNGESGQKEKLAQELSSIAGSKPDSIAELSIKKLLPEDKRDKIKHTFNYRVSSADLKSFSNDIETFLRSAVF